MPRSVANPRKTHADFYVIVRATNSNGFVEVKFGVFNA